MIGHGDMVLNLRLGPKLCAALVRAGAKEDELLHLANDENVAGHVVRLLKGEGVFLPLGMPGPVSLSAPEPEAEPEPTQPSIDCSVRPFVPDGWSIEPGDQIASRFRGELIWTPGAVDLYLDDGQKGSRMKGTELKQALEGRPVLPANALDWLLANPEGIPDGWKGKWTYFWGTIYRVRSRNPVVRCLYWNGGQWNWGCSWLEGTWYGYEPAAVPAGVF